MRHNNIGAHAWVKWIDCILSCFVPMSISISICLFWTVRCSLFRLLIYDTAYTMHAIFCCCCCCSFWSFSLAPSVSFSSLVSVNYFSHSRSRLNIATSQRIPYTHIPVQWMQLNNPRNYYLNAQLFLLIYLFDPNMLTHEHRLHRWLLMISFIFGVFFQRTITNCGLELFFCSQKTKENWIIILIKRFIFSQM